MDASARESFRVRAARMEDEALLRELIPEAGAGARWSCRFVAEDRHGSPIGGAVGVSDGMRSSSGW